jgi:DNA topoisomerase VI subunit B
VLKNELEPEQRANVGSQAIGKTEFVRKEEKDTSTNFGMVVRFTYEVYRAPNAATAQDFLKRKAVTQPRYYIVVETPEGNYGRDTDGIYKE